MSKIIDLNDILKTEATFTYKDKEYVFKFDDASDRALQEVWIKATAYATELSKDEGELDKKPVEEQVNALTDAMDKQHQIVMEYFVSQIGKTKAETLYKDLGKSTNGLMFVLGLVKRESDKAIEDAQEATYPEFDGND
ncbi:hypothetical protein [Lacticaseibacillus songhuajiangensis]|jgi:hypothetical protein|uniref:hypothetical protein n=1 Tax=Lacticaseibacillus songhuajiangensis TaxID=1296539 RepID=UPI000F777189|nr:hypothetical protein [Lacticaseibacillus songhuajiangensis]